MKKEQREAIKSLNEFVNTKYGAFTAKEARTVLSMLQEKDREINRKSSTINALQCALHERTEERDRKANIITKQRKQIDLMAEWISERCFYKDCIKQYFKSKEEKE